MKKTQHERMKGTASDYMCCGDCGMFVDFWKFDSLEDTGHENCIWRHATQDEWTECAKDCEANGCFDEEFL